MIRRLDVLPRMGGSFRPLTSNDPRHSSPARPGWPVRARKGNVSLQHPESPGWGAQQAGTEDS
jgi:hypothetical protein